MDEIQIELREEAKLKNASRKCMSPDYLISGDLYLESAPDAGVMGNIAHTLALVEMMI
jgi:hypothetical protein